MALLHLAAQVAQQLLAQQLLVLMVALVALVVQAAQVAQVAQADLLLLLVLTQQQADLKFLVEADLT